MRALVMSLALLSACNSGALVVVTVASSTALAPTAISGSATLGGTTKAFNLPVAGNSIPPDFVFGLELPPSATGSISVTVTTVGLANNLSATDTIAVVPHGRANLTLNLGQPPSDMGVSNDMTDRDALPVFTKQFVVSTITLAKANNDYGYDLDGDGSPDNAYGRIVVAGNNLTNPAAELDQPLATAAILQGTQPTLLALHSVDSAFQDDVGASTQLAFGMPQVPKFDGTDHFTVNSALTPQLLPGVLAKGVFSSTPTPMTTDPHTIHIKLAVIGVIVPVTLIGTHVSYTYVSGGVMMGQLNGAIPIERFHNETIPVLAAGLTTIIQSGMGGASTYKALFDTGDSVGSCDAGTQRDMAGGGSCVCAVANDNVIDPCELLQNGITSGLTAPDVDLLDGNNAFKPDSTRQSRDSLSVGFAFTAIPATF